MQINSFSYICQCINKPKLGVVSHHKYKFKATETRLTVEREEMIMVNVKKVYDFESYELDNVYNEEGDRYVRENTSIWYN